MITSCNFIAPNGDPSALGKFLQDKYGDRALQKWSFLHSHEMQTFIDQHFHESFYNLELGELTPKAAEYFLHLSDNGLQFSSREYKSFAGKEAIDIDSARDTADAGTGHFRTQRVDNTHRILKGFQTLTVRTTKAVGMDEVGDSMVVYMEGKPVRVTYQGLRSSTDTAQDIVSLGLPVAGDISSQFNDKNYDAADNQKAAETVSGWLYKEEPRHVYSYERINSLESIMRMFGGESTSDFNPMRAVDVEALNKTIRAVLPAVLDEQGNETGEFFSFELMNSSIEYVNVFMNKMFKDLVTSGDKLNVQMLIDSLVKAKMSTFGEYTRYKRFSAGGMKQEEKERFGDLSAEEIENRMRNFYTLYNSFGEIVPFLLDRLVRVGQSVNPKTAPKIKAILSKSAVNLRNSDESRLEESDDSLVLDEDEVNQTESSDIHVTEETVRGVTDWSTQHIHIDPLLTASRNVKLFLSTINEHEFGKQTPKNQVKIDFSESYLDVYRDLVKSKQPSALAVNAEQLAKLGVNFPYTTQIDGKWYTIEGVRDIPSYAKSRSYVTANPGAEKLLTLKALRRHNREPKAAKNKDFGTNRYADPISLFQNLLREAQKATNPELKDFIKAFKASRIPNVVKIGHLMESGAVPQDLVSSLKLAVDKQYIEHYIQLGEKVQKRSSTLYKAVQINANTTSERNVLITQWREAQKVSALVVEKDGVMSFDYKKIRKYRDRIWELRKAVREVNYDKTKSTESRNTEMAKYEQEAESLVSKILTSSGITVDTEVIKSLVGTVDVRPIHFFKSNHTLDVLLSPKGIIGILLEGYLEGDTEFQRDSGLTANNPLYNKQHIIRELAKLQIRFSSDPVFGITHKSAEGKITFAFSNHTYESRTIQSLKNADSTLSRKLRDLMPESWFLNQFHRTDSQAANKAEPTGDLAYLDALTLDGTAKIRSDMGDREQLVLSLNAFFRNGGSKADFIDMTKSDKSMTPMFLNMGRLSRSQAISEMSNIVSLELSRVRQWHKDRDSIDNLKFHRGGHLFYFLPKLNDYNALSSLPGINKTALNEMYSLDAQGNRTFNPEVPKESFYWVLTATVEDYIRTETSGVMEQMRSEGISGKKPLISDFAISKYVEKLNEYMGVERAIQKKFDKKGEITYMIKGEDTSSDAVKDIVLNYMIQEYVANYLVFNTSVAMTMSGDPAFFYKAKNAKNVYDEVEQTLAEYQKRLAKDIAPGLDPDWGVNEEFTSLTISDPVLRSELFGEFDTAADAQEVTTVKEHLYVAHKSGKISLTHYNEMVDIIDNAKDGYYEFTEERHLQHVMQPMKPVYVNRRFDKGSLGFMQVDYIKTSSFPLLPQMLRGTELDKLRRAMEDQNIQRAVFSSGNKAGSPVKALELFDGKGNIILDALEPSNVIPSTNKLKRGGFRIQQEVPYEVLKREIHSVSQMDKLIVEGIETIEDFQLNGKQLTGDEIRNAKELNRKRIFQEAFKEFENKVGGIEVIREAGEGVSDHMVGKLRNPEKFFDMLTMEAIKMGYSKPDIDALRTRINGELRMPLWFNGSADKLESMIMSMVRKIVVSKTPGKSYIQGSSLGIKYKTPEDLANSGIVFVDNPNNQYDPEKGLQFVRKGKDGKVIPAQILVPFNFDDGNGNLLDIRDFTYEKDGRTLIDPKALPAALLQLVGARIPNQGFSSMLPMEIVGFIPHQMGDFAMVPAEITQQMGADFDVDKLYTYRRNYRYLKEEAKVYEPRDFVGTDEYDGESATTTRLQDEYFDIHWSILNHPKIFDRITQPLDKSDLVDEMVLAKARKPAVGRSNFFGPIRQLRDYAAQKDAKTLVAASSLFSTFAADIQRHNLYLSELDFVDGESVRRRKYIEVMDESGETLRLTNLSGRGESTYVKDGQELTDIKSATRSKVINNTIMQNEFLDYSKNRTIDSFNLNKTTYPVAATLMLLSTDGGTTNGAANVGKSLNLKFATRLLQQQIIVDFVGEAANAEDLFSEGFGNGERKVIEDITRRYKKLAGLEDADPIPDIVLSPQKLLELLDGDRNSKDYYKHQLAAFKLFTDVNEVAKELKTIMSNYNTDTKGPGANVIKALDRLAKNRDILDNGTIHGVEEFLNTSQKGEAYKQTMNAVFGAFNDLFPHNKLVSTFGEVLQHMGKGSNFSEDMFRDLSNHTKAYIMSTNYMNVVEDVDKTVAYFLYDSPNNKSLAKRVEDAKLNFKSGKMLLNRLRGQIANDPAEPSLVLYNPSRSSTYELEENYRGFMELLLSQDPTEVELGQDLIKYTLLTDASGGNTSLMRFIPSSYYTINGVDSKLRTLMKTDYWGDVMSNFPVQYLQHHPDKVVRFPQEMQLAVVGERIVSTEKSTYLSLNRPPELLVINPDKISDAEVREYYSLKVKDSHYLYHLIDNRETGNIIYQRLDKLGSGNIREYNPSVQFKRSVISGNRTKYTPAEYTNFAGYHIPTLEKQGLPLPNAYLKKHAGPLTKLFNGREVVSLMEAYESIDAPLTRLLTDIASVGFENQVEVRVKNLGSDIEGRAEVTETGGTIYLNPALVSDKATFDRVVAHEVLHLITLKIFNDFKTDRASAQKRYGPKATAAYNRLEELRTELVARFASMSNKELQEGNMQQVALEMNYALTSIDEFAAAVLTNPTIQNYLNEQHDSKGRSMFSKITMFFKNLISALAAQFGIDIKPGSELESSLNSLSQMIGASEGLKSMTGVAKELGLSAYSKKAETIPVDIKAGIDDLKTLRSVLYNIQAITPDKNSPEYSTRSNQISDIAAAITDTSKNPEYVTLFIGAENHIKYAERIVERGGGNFNELQTAMVTVRTWSSIIDRTYTNAAEKPDEIDSILARTKTAEANIERLFKDLVVKEDGSIIDDIKDFNPENMEAGVLYKLRALNQFKSKVAQDIHRKVSGASMLKTSEERRFLSKIWAMQEKVAKMAKDRGVKPQDIMDSIMKSNKSSWGMTDIYSDKYYDKLADMEHRFEIAHLRAHSKNNIKFINNARRRIVKTLSDDFMFLNLATVLDEGTGEFKTDKKATAEISRFRALADMVDSTLADELINKARTEYVEFLGMRDTFQAQLEEQTQDRLKNIERILKKELSAMDPAAAKRRLADEKLRIRKDATRRLETFIQENSSYEFYKSVTKSVVSGTDVESVVSFKNWSVLHLMPKPNKSEFFDPKIHDIAADPELLEVYRFFRSSFNNFRDMLPPNVVDDLRDDFIPVVKTTERAYTRFGNVKDSFGRILAEGMSHELDYIEYTEQGKSKIPIRYVNGSHIDNKDRERNLFTVLEKFSKMALHFKYMAGVQSYAELMAYTIDQATNKGPGGSDVKYKNERVKDLYDAAVYHMNTLMYQKPKDIEFKQKEGKYLYGDSVFDSKRLRLELEALEKQLAEVRAARIDEIEKELADEVGSEIIVKSQAAFNRTVKSLTTRIEAIMDQRRVVNGTAISDSLIKFTQLKMLGWSPKSAFVNLTFGLLTASSHASMGVDFTERQLLKSIRIMNNATRRALGDKNNKTAEKIMNLIERSGVMGDIIQVDNAGETRTEAKAKGWKRTLSPFQMLRQSDYYMKGLIVVSMAQNTTVTRNDGTKASLWDALNEDGSVDNADTWFHEDITLETDFMKFQRRAIGVNNMVMGNQDPNSPLLARKTTIGRLLGQFKLSWMPELYAVRFQNKVDVSDMEREIKGSYITAWEQRGNAGHFLWTALKGFFSFYSEVEFKAKNGIALSQTDLANMRRNASDLRFMILMGAMVLMLRHMSDDDDDKFWKNTTITTLNLLLRNYEDLTFFMDVNSIDAITKGVVPATSIITSTTKAFEGVYKIATQDEDARFTQKQMWYRWLRVFPFLNQIPGIENTTTKVANNFNR